MSFLGLSLSLNAQYFKILTVKKVEGIKNASKAKFSANNSTIIYTSKDYNGLYRYNLAQKKSIVLNHDIGAGYNYRISADAQTVIYKTYNIEKNNRRYNSLVEQNLNTLEKTFWVKNVRNISNFSIQKGKTSFISNSKLQIKGQNNRLKNDKEVFAFNDHNLNLILVKDSAKIILNPLGEGSYIWIELSPKGDKILFNKAGKGTYICDLKGKILADLGRFHAAKWSVNGKWIIGMNDYDNGHAYTKSSIVISNSDASISQVLELKNIPIALYPDWSSDLKKIIFNTPNNELFLIELQ